MSESPSIPRDLVPAYSLLFGASGTLQALDARTLRRVYRRRALETHPDRARATGADPALLTRRFQEVTAAYECLGAYLSAASRTRAESAARAPASSARAPASSAPPQRARAHTGGSPRADGPRAERPRREPSPRPASDRSGARAGAAATAAAHGPGTPHAGPPPPPPDDRDHFWGGHLPQHDLLLGQYLYYSGRISWRALIGAIHWQRSQRPHLGQLAVRKGYLAPERVRELMATKRFDERFGDAAVRLGYLRPESRDALVGLQRALQQRLGQYFVAMGILGPDEVQQAAVRQMQHNWSRPRDPRASRL